MFPMVISFLFLSFFLSLFLVAGARHFVSLLVVTGVGSIAVEERNEPSMAVFAWSARSLPARIGEAGSGSSQARCRTAPAEEKGEARWG